MAIIPLTTCILAIFLVWLPLSLIPFTKIITAFLVQLADICTTCLIKTVGFFEKWPYSTIELYLSPLQQWLLALAVLCPVVYKWWPTKRTYKKGLILLMYLLLFSTGAISLQQIYLSRQRYAIHIPSLSKGTVIMMETPQKNLLFADAEALESDLSYPLKKYACSLHKPLPKWDTVRLYPERNSVYHFPRQECIVVGRECRLRPDAIIDSLSPQKIVLLANLYDSQRDRWIKAAEAKKIEIFLCQNKLLCIVLNPVNKHNQ